MPLSWPKTPSRKQRTAIEASAKRILEVRKEFPDSTLADLYDPLAMPPALVWAHAELDRAVDLCYRPQPLKMSDSVWNIFLRSMRS